MGGGFSSGASGTSPARPLSDIRNAGANGGKWVKFRIAGSELRRANDAPLLNRRADGSVVNGVRASTHGQEFSVKSQDAAHVDGKGNANCIQSVDSYIYIC